MKTPRARAFEALMSLGEKPKNSTSNGLGGIPKLFSTSNLILFVSINSVQNFKTVAIPLLGEKFVVGGGWCKPIIVLSFGQAEQYIFMKLSFNGKLTSEEMYCRGWSSRAEFQDGLQELPLKKSKRL